MICYAALVTETARKWAQEPLPANMRIKPKEKLGFAHKERKLQQSRNWVGWTESQQSEVQKL